MYDIQITYTTGDSFHTYTEVDNVNIPVTSLEHAKINLARIKEHYNIYQKKDRYFLTPSQRCQLNNTVPDFYITEYLHSGRKWECNGIRLLTDTGTHDIINPFWIGFFERLQSAKVVAADDTLEFTL